MCGKVHYTTAIFHSREMEKLIPHYFPPKKRLTLPPNWGGKEAEFFYTQPNQGRLENCQQGSECPKRIG
jgi:hypothetical protein